MSAGSAISAGDCGQPVSSGTEAVVSDCLFILQSAVGQHECDPACICDLNGGGIATSDALLCLRNAVGQEVTLACECPSTTTTTIEFPTTTLPFGPRTVTGCVTQGVECRILTSGGKVYSFAHPYVEVGKCYEVTGMWQIAGYCMQGTQLSVSRIIESPYDCCAP